MPRDLDDKKDRVRDCPEQDPESWKKPVIIGMGLMAVVVVSALVISNWDRIKETLEGGYPDRNPPSIKLEDVEP